jgi:sterol desaturase/sphingolipid hydroxylase (fatty acid hydroxylase superfamily)
MQEEVNYTSAFFIILLLFVLLYFSVGTIFLLLSNLLVKKNYAGRVSFRPHFENQLLYEIKHGVFATIIFAGYGVLIVWLFRNHVLQINHTNDIMILTDLLILAIWNEIHFYLVHRLMHTKLFLPFHTVHHKSVVVTPFSAYSFHPIESLLNGSVMIIPMFFHDFEFVALLILPVYSIILNMAGHSNVKIYAFTKLKTALHMSSRHNAHHSKFNVNFGFASPIMDFLFTRKKSEPRQQKNKL